MRVRCGACRTEFEVTGPGRYRCARCGSVNEVRDTGGVPGSAEAPPQPAPPPPDPPSPRVACPDCSFSFIVGQIEVATCPNCGTSVTTGAGTR